MTININKFFKSKLNIYFAYLLFEFAYAVLKKKLALANVGDNLRGKIKFVFT